MRYGWMIALALAGAAQAAPPAGSHSEAAEDKARTVPGGASKGVKACHEDIEKLCAGVKPGKGRLGKCLKAHPKELSEPCRVWLRHGGQAHVDRAFTELDPSSAPAKGADAKP